MLLQKHFVILHLLVEFAFSFLKFEKLKYQYSGCCSVRIANGHIERLIFTEHEGGITIKLLKLDDSHYGNKK